MLFYLLSGGAVIGALVNETMGERRLLVTALLCALWCLLIGAISHREPPK